MLRTFWNAQTAMNAIQNKLETISNNMANVNTIGYKKADVGFEELFQESLKRKGYPTSIDKNKNLTLGTGIKTFELTRENTQGALRQTDKNSDFAIDGDGLFKVFLSNNKIAYSRAGNFQININGKLIDQNGNRISIVDNNGREISQNIHLNKDNFKVNSLGEIIETKSNGKSVKLGKIGVYTAIGSDAFKSIGENLYVPSNNNVKVNLNKDCNIMQGYLEISNVKLEDEMSDLIITQRAFQLNSTALKTADEIWGMANNLVRR